MKKLESLDQLKVGTKLKIVALRDKDCYNSVSVKKVIDCGTWHEILINKKKNYYFHFENYLAGKSNWVKEVYVLAGDDRLNNKSSVNIALAKLIYSSDPRTALVEFGNALFYAESLIRWAENGWSLGEHREKFAKFMKEAYIDDRFEQLLQQEKDNKCK